MAQRGPNFATFHFCHVSDASDADAGASDASDVDDHNASDDLIASDKSDIAADHIQKDLSDDIFGYNEYEDDVGELNMTSYTQNHDIMTTSVYGQLMTNDDKGVSPDVLTADMMSVSADGSCWMADNGSKLILQQEGYLYQNQSDDENTKKRTPRYGNDECELKLEPQKTRKLTYSAEDVQRLAAEAEVLVLQRRNINNHQRRRKQLPRPALGSSCYNSSGGSEFGGSGGVNGSGQQRRRNRRRSGQQRKKEWRKSLPCKLELNVYEGTTASALTGARSKVRGQELEYGVEASGGSVGGSTGSCLSQDLGYESLTKLFIGSTTTTTTTSTNSNNNHQRSTTKTQQLLTTKNPGTEDVKNAGNYSIITRHDVQEWSLDESSGAGESAGSTSAEEANSGVEVKKYRSPNQGRKKKKRKSSIEMKSNNTSTNQQENSINWSASSSEEWDTCHAKQKSESHAISAVSGGLNIGSAGRFNCEIISGRSSVASDRNYSSPESQFWDKEDYLSEYQYDELVDEEGLRTILSLGEDFSNLHHPYSSLEYDSLQNPSYSSLEYDHNLQNLQNQGDNYSSTEYENELTTTLLNKSADSFRRMNSSEAVRRFSKDEVETFSKMNSELKYTTSDIDEEYSSLVTDQQYHHNYSHIQQIVNSEDSHSDGIENNDYSYAKEEHFAEKYKKNKGGLCDDVDRTAVLQSKAKKIKTELQHIIQINSSAKKGQNSLELQVHVDKLFVLKGEIFELNLSVHRLIKEQDQNGGGKQLLDDVIQLYTLLRQAKQLTSEGQEDASDDIINQSADKIAALRKRRRKKKSAKGKFGEQLSHPEDSGYSDFVPTGGNGRLQNDGKAVDKGLSPTESSAGWGSGVTWSRVGKFCMYTCFLVAALLPVAMMSQVECCDRMNTYRPIFRFQYSNGPPPI